MLSAFANANENNWDELIPYVLFVYRSSVQASIKFTPYYVLFGREVMMLVDLIFNLEPPDKYSSTPECADIGRKSEICIWCSSASPRVSVRVTKELL